MEILVEGCAERQVRPELGELRLGLEHDIACFNVESLAKLRVIKMQQKSYGNVVYMQKAEWAAQDQ